MYTYYLLQSLAFFTGLSAFLFLLFLLHKEKISFFQKKSQKKIFASFIIILSLISGFFANKSMPPNFAMPMFMHAHTPDKLSAAIPFFKIIEFLWQHKNFEKVLDIGANPNTVPSAAQAKNTEGIVEIELITQEVVGEISPGIYFNYWTFNKQVPGPMLRIQQNDTIHLKITNHPSSLHEHNIDLHAVTGQGGGAKYTGVKPGETRTLQWKALNPGLYIYHCAMPNVSTHNSHGQYGLILVEPEGGLNPVDKEFYIVQGELYTQGDIGKKGLVVFDSEALISGDPNYITFNGKIETEPRMQAQAGDTVRIYVGNGGVNHISSFHVIGEIFDKVYPNASLNGAMEFNTQTALVLPGGASIVEFKVDVPGKYLLVDHALARMNKGAWAVLEVFGETKPEIFSEINSTKTSHSHHE